ncbi:MAG: formyltransferase family protein [Planctomycetota bacterium]|nr:formyltransferase family protein [Planctomycetota bacterium]MDA1213771.1 formyltransferase family protein [Planctomycetota bacterium]
MTDSEPVPSRPRVLLLTTPSLYGVIIMNSLERHPDLDVVGVLLSNRIYKGKSKMQAVCTFFKRTGLHYTWFSFLTNHLAWTILRMLGQPKNMAENRKLIRIIDDVNSPEIVNLIREKRPDYVVSFYFNQWIGPDVRSIPRWACVNVHPSCLPELRGPDPIFRTIERDLTQSGLTIHAVEDKFDEGSIVHQETRTVPPGISVLGFYLQQVREGSKVLANWIARKRTAIEAMPNGFANSPGDYSTFPTPAEVDEFLDSGKRLYTLREYMNVLRDINGLNLG